MWDQTKGLFVLVVSCLWDISKFLLCSLFEFGRRYLFFSPEFHLWLCRNQKTFRPKKSAPSGSKVGVITYIYIPQFNSLWLLSPVICIFLLCQRFIFLLSDGSNIYYVVGMQGAQLQKHIDATLGSGNLREAVRLPPGEDINEWLAVNSKNFESLSFWNSRSS